MSKFHLESHKVVIGLLLVLAGALSARSQEPTPLSPAQIAAVRQAVAAPAPVSYLIVKEDFTGDFQTIRGNIDKFMKDFEEQNLESAVEKTTPTALLVFKDNPDEKKQFSYSIGLTIPSRVQVKAPLSIASLRYSSAVKVTHKGQEYQQLGLIYKNVAALQAKKAKAQAARFPVVLELLNDPARVPHSQVATRMVVPVGPISQE